MADQYDVIVIGGGPGGYVAAIRAAQLGLKTACIEAEDLGGVCLNWGCIPSKTLIANSQLVYNIRNHAKEFGLNFEKFEADYDVAVKRSRKVVKRLVGGVGFLFKKYGVEHIKGYGTLTGPHTVEVDGTRYEGKHIIIATGATWMSPSDVGAEGELDGEQVVSYRDAIVQNDIPGTVIVVGAGAIGVEFAYVYNSYGADVTIVEYMPRLLPREDVEVSDELTKQYKKQGINLKLGQAVKKVERQGDKVHVTVEAAGGGEQEVLEADRVLIALGFRPRSEGIGLEAAGVEVTKRGYIEIDELSRTNVPHIFAIGDVSNNSLALAHVASHQGIVAAETIAGNPQEALDFKMMPRATYCNPQVASMGYTEEELKEQGIPYNVGKFSLAANGKAMGLNEPIGFVKILAHEKYGEILGAHLIGPEVTELIAEFNIAHQLESTPTEIFHAVHPHPTLSEAIAEAAMAVEGLPINS
ncbi:MAG: dihydrolipoyl dehydrogenase [Anaerolineales bacterium]|nr:dihydrolipoyl dehydrogenase [Anaerolineales bacterium]MCB9126427.1 dihydrolipoyl dehydrogenase [Ardenticatenales bacterium]MCB9171588.1 dihydrolipoyl dehydrogenase [Ardenticatenales bacterium]